MKQFGSQILLKISSETANWSGNIAGICLVVLTLSICYGVVTRLFSIGDYYSFDVNLFALVWFSMLGAAFTAAAGSHVIAGIALERYFHLHFPIFSLIRTILVVAVMLLLFWVGLQQTISSVASHEVTLDLAAWPVWISRLPIALGPLAWAIAEMAHLAESWSEQR